MKPWRGTLARTLGPMLSDRSDLSGSVRVRLPWIALLAAFPFGPLQAENSWLWGLEDLAGAQAAASDLESCLSTVAVPRDCVGVVEADCPEHRELCINLETFGWQALGQGYLDRIVEALPDLAPRYLEGQELWRAYAWSRCSLVSDLFPNDVLMSRVVSSGCRLASTSDRAFGLREDLMNMGEIRPD